LIILTQSKDVQFKEIISMGLIDKVNYLIDYSYNNNNITNNDDDENSYLDYIFELYYEMMEKIFEYKKINYPKNVKLNVDSYKKDFLSKVENVGKNFNLCIKLLGNQNNVNVQEMACVCLIYILQILM